MLTVSGIIQEISFDGIQSTLLIKVDNSYKEFTYAGKIEKVKQDNIKFESRAAKIINIIQ